MTDSLAEELQPLGVHVSAVNPGEFASEICVMRCMRMLKNSSDDWGLFEDRHQEMLASCEERLKPGFEDKGTPPDAVARTIEQALFDENPRGRYLVASQGGAGETIAWAIREMLALNP